MKISTKQYAQALFDLTAQKDKKEVTKTIAEFVRVLVLNNHLSRAQEIINEFEKLTDVKDNIVRAKVQSAKELENDSLDSVSSFVKEVTKAEKVVLEQEVKKDLLGGVIVRYGDRVIDFSLKNKVRELREKMSK
jgi:F-type H+-transporting ATPase subunit delta